ncbi:hypothetical protein RND71_013170 [Anisodus tanguticus]|uniref:Uncharacterized protein n=1 Tax=Anisodus tanguticus TaxID=243964 RepID=A0AAE1SHC7_9SOLA|nr:hypothetical protein RND71_013170 [Anisodus tanguticus]
MEDLHRKKKKLSWMKSTSRQRERQSLWGLPKFVSHETYKEASNGYLVDKNVSSEQRYSSSKGKQLEAQYTTLLTKPKSSQNTSTRRPNKPNRAQMFWPNRTFPLFPKKSQTNKTPNSPSSNNQNSPNQTGPSRPNRNTTVGPRPRPNTHSPLTHRPFHPKSP